MTRRTKTAAALVAATLLPVGDGLALAAPSPPVRQAPAAPGPPTGDAAGIALARLANAFYAKQPRMGVELRVPLSPGVQIHRLLLRRGQIEGTFISAAIGRDRAFFVESPKGNFARLREDRCWYRQPGSSPRQSMISLRGSRVLAPEPIGALTRLEINERDPATGRRQRIQYRIDPKTGRIATITQDLVATVRTLPAPPAIPVPKPLCSELEDEEE
jgi:hypothetical protein